MATFSSAQTSPATAAFPPEKTVKSWILGDDPRQLAWGAHDALIAGYRDLIPDLLSLASRWQPLPQRSDRWRPAELSPRQTDERDAMAAVLDTLILMNVVVPTDTLRALAADFGNDVAVLLPRLSNEQSGPLCLDLYLSLPETADGLRYACTAILALHPRPGFAADLLASVTVQAWIFVVLPNTERPGFWHSDRDCGDFFHNSPRKDWPVTGQYSLSQSTKDRAWLVVAGIDPIYATRKESTTYHEEVCPPLYLGNRERQRLIAEMLDVPPDEIPWEIEPITTIEFQSLQQFDGALLAFVEKQQGMYRETAEALEARDLLRPSELNQSIPELRLHLEDSRDTGCPSIPNPTKLPPRVTFSRLP